MNYIGSKLSLLGFIDEAIKKVVDFDKLNKNNIVFADLFAGTGIVGSYFKKKGYKIISNDIQYYSFVLNKHNIGNHLELEFNNLYKELKEVQDIKKSERKDYIINYLNNISHHVGFVAKNYCSKEDEIKSEQDRLYWSYENGKKCDAIRMKIEEWKNNKLINDNEYYFLLASLIESVDKVANTASVYGAYLKKIKKSAKDLFTLKGLELVINDKEHDIYNQDINKLIHDIEMDILYLDPPYNHRQYATNYHPLETIAKYDNPQLSGKTGLRNYENQKSKYCSKSEAIKSFEYLINNAKAKYIFLSYNNEGIMSVKDIKNILSKKGEYGCFEKEYHRFKADKDINREHKAKNVTEYIHYVVCRN